jgi:capsular polysaccharide biosynthesis protein
MYTCIHIFRLEHLYCSDLINEADLAVIYKRLTHTSIKSPFGSALINEQNNGKNPEKSKQICENFLMNYKEKNKKIVDTTIEDFMSVRHDNVSKFRPPDMMKISGLGGPVLGKEIVFD